jgi:uncharacterized membrane protein
MNHYLAFQVHGNADKHGSILDGLTGLLTFFENLTANGGDGFFATLLPGLAGINNIHPLLVHFPIALLSLFFILEVFATVSKKPHWREVGSYFLYFGALTAVFTVIAGFVAAYSVEHNDTVHHIMLRHQYIGLAVTGLAIVLSIWRYKAAELTGGAKHFFLILATVMTVLLMLGADLGGLMVYHYGTGVQAQVAEPAPTTPEQHEHHHND